MSTIVTKDNAVKGMKVVRGRDWDYDDQDKGSVYGIITGIHRNWASIDWIFDGRTIAANNYRIGDEGKFDLYVYEEEQKPVTFQRGRLYKVIDDRYEYLKHYLKVGHYALLCSDYNPGEQTLILEGLDVANDKNIITQSVSIHSVYSTPLEPLFKVGDKVLIAPVYISKKKQEDVGKKYTKSGYSHGFIVKTWVYDLKEQMFYYKLDGLDELYSEIGLTAAKSSDRMEISTQFKVGDLVSPTDKLLRASHGPFLCRAVGLIVALDDTSHRDDQPRIRVEWYSSRDVYIREAAKGLRRSPYSVSYYQHHTASDFLAPLPPIVIDSSGSTTLQPKYKEGDEVRICEYGKCNGSGYWLAEHVYERILCIGGKECKVETAKYSSEKNEWYYKLTSTVNYIAEHALTLVEEKPTIPEPKFKVGDIIRLTNPTHPSCRTVDGHIDSKLGKSLLVKGHTDTITEVCFHIVENCYYYKISDTDVWYREECLTLKYPAKKSETTPIHNPQKPSNHGKHNEEDGVIKVRRPVGTVPVTERRTGTPVSGRRISAAVGRGHLVYKA